VKTLAMISNYLKVALKVLVRRKFFTVVSLFGIAFTLMVLVVAVAILDNALAPLAPESKMDRTLHVTAVLMTADDGEEVWSFKSSPGYRFLDRYVRDLPGVETMSIYSKARAVTGFADGEKIVSRIRYVDGAYWEILDFEFLEGRPFTQDDDDSARLVAVISEATRRRYFQEKPALDKTIEAGGRIFRVVGVVDDVAITRRSAVADIWVPHGAAKSQGPSERLIMSFYHSRGYEALLLARNRGDFSQIRSEYEARLPHVELPPPYTKAQGVPLTRLEQYVVDMEFKRNVRPPTTKILLIWVAMFAAFLVLPTTNLISINLSRFMERSTEIGVRRTFGASSAHLVGQFVVENVFLCMVGGAIALVGALVVLNLIENSGWLPYADLDINFRVFLCGLALAVFFGLLSGAYPAWRTSRLHPVNALRGGA
jgi:putative ABC transport system permease protein